jgi:hypothetical protein
MISEKFFRLVIARITEPYFFRPTKILLSDWEGQHPFPHCPAYQPSEEAETQRQGLSSVSNWI